MVYLNIFRQQFVDFFELPEEAVADLPLIMLAGSKKLFLENHKGIATYRQEFIKIRIKQGFLVIEGDRLKIKEIARENLQVSGLIINLAFDLV